MDPVNRLKRGIRKEGVSALSMRCLIISVLEIKKRIRVRSEKNEQKQQKNPA